MVRIRSISFTGIRRKRDEIAIVCWYTVYQVGRFGLGILPSFLVGVVIIHVSYIIVTWFDFCR